ncbi:MAG TPA: hypothetical protein VJC21_06075 [Candidatus Nanoarchaeia archaeon]|nr:hypothetical protein [Candidatus Nanoarchaeia archaeon]
MVDGTFTSIPFVVLVLVYLVTSLAYAFSHKYIQSPSRLIERYPQQFFIQMDYRYLVSKSFDILFQQMMILMLVLWLSQQGFSLSMTMLFSLLLFGGVHIFALIPAGKLFGMYYLIASLLGAVVFPLLVLTVNYGFVYSYALHFFFYTASAVFFWLFAPKILREG